MKDMSSAIVEALGKSQKPVDGQSQYWQPSHSQAPLTPNSHATWNRLRPSGHVNLSQPPPEEAECFSCGSIGHYAKDCPNRFKQTHLNCRQPSMQ